ncbi:MAG: hypothetical protein PHQ74_01345 [Crocinitomicaceae bacterium]|nr:hypothetical protein [Crocinitomicaceae bacterium]
MKTILSTLLLTVSSFIFSQNNSNPWPTSGNVGIGTNAPKSNLHIHGTSDYSITYPEQSAVYDILGNLITPSYPGYTTYYGKTSRFQLTNSTIGLTTTDGANLRLSDANLVLENLESNGTLQFEVPGLAMNFSASTKRIFSGATQSSAATFAKFNLSGGDNGLYIHTVSSGKYGISIRSTNTTDNAIQVMGTTGTTRNFSVKANGEVFARKYTTTLNNIPDYVFDPSYQLMPLSELRTYLTLNRHLPNVPSAKEYTETGVDLGEMNRVLLEKTEELTLYILQLEVRLKALEEKP